ncbi:S-adenosyl-L-methionine-dependent methyltransferase [Choiromyces venosus 120613-1]|uniref:S-adenosyl-L-methionine-dependent methyltransferase n=1 Tax=Choiromyces venosus 120613-1 TaxID=1336337 RepID=A0A3N4IWW8_9PEZI|nr:S-adenosyl-L-methionine-dependent methyltransferase [Choiromyces venosus 120613-1]
MADFHQSIASGPTSQFPALDIDTSPHDYSDVDSGFGASIARTENSYAVTMGSGICPYVYENGRRYQVFREGVYMLPNDSEEIERLDQYHRIFLALLDGKLYIAPLGEHSQKVRHVLDIGTGTGAWAIDMAEEFPDAEVIGNDLSKIQPPWAPENCKFEIDDIESDWTYPENHFDFIHLRSLSGCFEDWGMVLSRCYNHTAPGGYIEFQDYDCILKSALGTVPNGAVARYWRMVCDAAESTGRIFQVASTIEGLLKAAGFVDVTVRKELWPLGPWPKDERMKEIGRLTKPGLRSAFHAFASALLTRVLGWTDIQVKELCQEATQEINDGSSQLYVTAYYVCGRKPS